MRLWVVTLLLGAAAGCGGDTTTVVNEAPPETTTVTEQTTTTTTTKAEPDRRGPAGNEEPDKINGIVNGPIIGVDLTANAYREDMRAWGPLSYDTKVALARMFIENNPNDCYTLSEVAGSSATDALALRVDQAMYAGQTGGMLISEVMLNACQYGAE